MFCFVEYNNKISCKKIQLRKRTEKRTEFQHTSGCRGVVDWATTYCLPLHNIYLGRSTCYLRKTSDLSFYFYIVKKYRMIIESTTTYSISVYHHGCCEFESTSMRGILDQTLCGKVCQ